tara:strand:+ start:75577 stop:75813 length:237 start_codon:yes stop_codon:yes gene_type:complete
MRGVIEQAIRQESVAQAKESHLRSILKAFSWRIVATATTATIAYFVTGEIVTALTIGSIEFFLKMFIYYAHERVWLLW